VFLFATVSITQFDFNTDNKTSLAVFLSSAFISLSKYSCEIFSESTAQGIVQFELSTTF
jgi:hypothetical protein